LVELKFDCLVVVAFMCLLQTSHHLRLRQEPLHENPKSTQLVVVCLGRVRQVALQVRSDTLPADLSLRKPQEPQRRVPVVLDNPQLQPLVN